MHEIRLMPSRRLGLLLSGMTGLALWALYLAALPWSIQWGLGLAATGLGVWGWLQARPRARLRIAADGHLQCLDDTAEWRDVEVLGDSFVSTALTVLRYRTAGTRVQSLTLLPDSAAPEALRRLRVSLRWAPRTRSDTAFPGAG